MTIDKDKVNAILKEFQLVLKKHKPNLEELGKISQKIGETYRRNLSQAGRGAINKTSPPRRSPKEKSWIKIPIE